MLGLNLDASHLGIVSDHFKSRYVFLQIGIINKLKAHYNICPGYYTFCPWVRPLASTAGLESLNVPAHLKTPESRS